MSESGTDGSPRRARSRWDVPEWLDHAAGWTWRALVLLAGVVVLGLALSRVRYVVLPILVATMLAALLVPLHRWLVEHRLPRLAATWVVMVAAAIVVAGAVAVVTVAVGDQLANADQWDDVREEVRSWLQTGPLDLTADEVGDLERRVSDAVVGGIATVDAGRARLVVDVVGAFFLTVVLLFFFLKEGEQLWRWGIQHVRAPRRDVVDESGQAAFDALGGYMRGVAITGLVDAVAIGVALVVIGVPLVVPLTVLTFLGAFFPIVGATVAGALAALVALTTNGPGDAVLIALVTLVVQQVEGDVVMPLIMRRQVQLHPAVVLTALAVGGALGGITGAFVAVPVVAMASAAARVARVPSSTLLTPTD